MLTTDLYLEPRLRMNRSTILFPVYAVLALLKATSIFHIRSRFWSNYYYYYYYYCCHHHHYHQQHQKHLVISGFYNIFVLIQVKTVRNSMVTPCTNNIQHFNFQLMHTTLKSVELLEHFKISKTSPTRFGLQENHHQGATIST